ncbi:hypothetical protein ACKKBF_B34255 [Auxenochlorella protothecoides x Auxenochlorella symbiontica]
MPAVEACVRCSATVGTSGRSDHTLVNPNKYSRRHFRAAYPRGRAPPRPRQEVPTTSKFGNGSGLHIPVLQDEEVGPQTQVWTTFVAETLLPTKRGKFKLRGYRHTTDGGQTFTEPCVIYCGDLAGRPDLPLRVHDACFTSEVLGSLKCDCREQLVLAMDHIRRHPPGAVIYLQQEGRGIGLANKIAAYALQERGLDTVDANRALGLPDDCREYSAVAHILADLGVPSVRLMTNNPRKMAEVAALGVAVTGRIPCVVPAQPHSRGYLDAKQARMDHILDRRGEGGAAGDDGDAASESQLDGSFCYWNHEGEPGPTGIGLKPAAAARPGPEEGPARE